MELNLFMYCFFFDCLFVFETALKDFPFYSLILLTLWFRCFQKRVKESMYLVSFWSIFLQNSLKDSKIPPKNLIKIHFPAICRAKFQKFCLQCQPWGHHQPLNWANSKETVSLEKNACRQKGLYKNCFINKTQKY